MRAETCHPGLHEALSARPSVGDLMALCEENYQLLARLAPNLPNLRGHLVSRPRGAVDLFLTIEEHAPYTSVVRLTHVFGHPSDRSQGPAHGSAAPTGPQGPDPDTRLRVYHDARQVEVLGLRQTALPVGADYRPPALSAKWKVNLFLGKWLSFCLRQGHRFGPAPVPLPADDDLLYDLT